MVGKSVVVLSVLIFGVAVFPGSLSARSAPKAVVSSRNAPKVVVPLFVKKPRLKVQYNFFVKVLTKQAPDIKIAFEKAFAWGFKPAKRSYADKKAETALLDALEADTKLAPVYKEAIFSFSEDMHPSPWGKMILGSVGGIAVTAALVAAGMWYRDKRRAEAERRKQVKLQMRRDNWRVSWEYEEEKKRKELLAEEQFQNELDEAQSLLKEQLALIKAKKNDAEAEHEQAGRSKSLLYTRNCLKEQLTLKIESDPLPEMRCNLTPAQLNDMKQLFGIESGTSDAESSVFVESRETAIWTAYCKDMASFMPQTKQEILHINREYRDLSRGGWCNIKMWQDAQRALNKRIELVASDLTAAALGVLGKGISNLPEIPDIFYYLRTGATVPENKIVFFDADGVEVEGALLGSVEKFDFLGRIANTPKTQKLTELCTLLTRAPQVPVVPPTTVVGAGSRAGVVGAGVGAGAPSGPGATDTSGAAAGRVG